MTPTRVGFRPAVVLAALAMLSTVPSASGQALPDAVTGPRPAGRVVDPTGRLTPEERREITDLLDGIATQTRGDMMVVVIPSTLGAPHRQFATALFNRWRLGTADRNDGLLLFAALDDRRAEIILGDGLDDEARRERSQRVMNGVMIPEFKAGRPGTAIRRGALACATELLGGGAEARATPAALPPAAVAIAEVPAESTARISAETTADRSAEPAAADPPPVAADGLPEPVAPRPWVAPPAPPAPGTPWEGLVALGGGITATGAGGYGLWRLATRRRRRSCPSCRVDMLKLDEIQDDSQLGSSQRAEEQVGSVDYDVWSCPSCEWVEKVRYGAFFTQYARCPACRAMTKLTTTSRLRSPTTTSEGTEEVTESCSHCGRTVQFRRSIPRLEASRSSSVNWSAGSSGSSFSSSCSSSSSGGGRSSGGGASGSW